MVQMPPPLSMSITVVIIGTIFFTTPVAFVVFILMQAFGSDVRFSKCFAVLAPFIGYIWMAIWKYVMLS